MKNILIISILSSALFACSSASFGEGQNDSGNSEVSIETLNETEVSDIRIDTEISEVGCTKDEQCKKPQECGGSPDFLDTEYYNKVIPGTPGVCAGICRWENFTTLICGMAGYTHQLVCSNGFSKITIPSDCVIDVYNSHALCCKLPHELPL